MLLVLWSDEDTTPGAASQRYQHTTTRIINLSPAGFDTTLLHPGRQQCVYTALDGRSPCDLRPAPLPWHWHTAVSTSLIHVFNNGIYRIDSFIQCVHTHTHSYVTSKVQVYSVSVHMHGSCLRWLQTTIGIHPVHACRQPRLHGDPMEAGVHSDTP